MCVYFISVSAVTEAFDSDEEFCKILQLYVRVLSLFLDLAVIFLMDPRTKGRNW